jgi:hypothetical protein
VIELKKGPLTAIRTNAFYVLNNVQKINLEKNEIQLIEASAFRSLPAITLINLSFNSLTAITDGAFVSVKSGATLDLEGCDKLVPSQMVDALCDIPKVTLYVKNCDTILSSFDNAQSFENYINNRCSFNNVNNKVTVQGW